MAYLSDIDLATLHKKRLEEKNNYKLSSWYNRRFYDEENCRETHSSIMIDRHRVKSKVSVEGKETTKSKTKSSPTNIQTSTKSVDDGEKLKIDQSSHVYDEGYFSSSTLNRRRSGTWP